NVLATSFHPELTGDHRVHSLFVDMVRANRTPESL
ncbi:pyridoxal 5'-phosphate synthase glutaminase subunit PdxT, partial [Streptomyces collinus]